MSTNSNHSGANPPDSSNIPAKAGETGPKPVPPTTLRDRKGQFLPGSHANPHGRPKGKLNRATLFAQALLEEAGPAVARRAILEAKAGCAAALKLVLERLIPVASDRRLHLDHLAEPAPRPKAADNYTPQDILHAHNKLVESVASGELSPIEAQAISQLLEARRRSWESLELSRRLSELEDQAAQSSHKPS